ASLRQRLEERVRGLSGVDEARLAAEIALLAERSDVREELDRLRAHVDRLFQLLESPDPVGKELEFLAQEIGREASTLGAKARTPGLAETALALKLGAERVREQARNVE
ncbi:MAG: endoribonuclease YicC domain-containing protein, partial [Candidatus Bipolaricaulaceae bacterium]